MRPARGNLLVREIETSETLPGGKVILPEQVREHFTAMQYEVVSVGENAICDDPETCEPLQLHCYGNHKKLEHPVSEGVIPGAWVLTKPRVAIDTGIDGLYIIRQDDVVATFTDSPTVAAS